MTDTQAEDQAGEETSGGGEAGATATDEQAGTPAAEPGGDAAGGAGDTPGDESAPGKATSGSGPPVGDDGAGDEGAERAADDPETRLQALQEDIDAVRRRVEEDTVGAGDERFIQEGEASEDEPVDDTIAPPG